MPSRTFTTIASMNTTGVHDRMDASATRARLLNHTAGDLRDRLARDLGALHLRKVGLYLAPRQTLRWKRDHHLTDTTKPALVFPHDPRIKAATTIPGQLDLDRPELPQQLLLTRSATRIHHLRAPVLPLAQTLAQLHNPTPSRVRLWSTLQAAHPARAGDPRPRRSVTGRVLHARDTTKTQALLKPVDPELLDQPRTPARMAAVAPETTGNTTSRLVRARSPARSARPWSPTAPAASRFCTRHASRSIGSASTDPGHDPRPHQPPSPTRPPALRRRFRTHCGNLQGLRRLSTAKILENIECCPRARGGEPRPLRP